ncbi:MAG: maltose alpha-D-glucosyltransferase [Caldilineaceae bacterium]|nr:maltose alpha-D-glucosyltransferase [Caldilineaceae bacterium]
MNPSTVPNADYISWLLDHSVLNAAAKLARQFSGQGSMWQRPYIESRPRAAAGMASVWFSSYPPAIITRQGESVLATLGDPALWDAFAQIGIKALHTGPMKQSGGVTGRTLTPTIDGNFDRIGLEIDPTFGTAEEFQAMSRTATAHGAVIIDDIIPGHTGKGPDFRLAERGVGDYPGLYHMVEIEPKDWAMLPDVAEGKDSVNLPVDVVDALQAAGYIVGQLSRTIFYEPGIKDTDWSATAPVVGADGITRRWVYLHYFKEGQPTLNWLDPSFAAPRFVIGDALHSLSVLGASMLRLDANGFLGIEQRPDGPAWSEGHPLSVIANQIIGGMVRKAGGFTFQELNLTVDDIAAMSHGAADLSYDFITRPAYDHALVTGDTGFLRLMLRTVHEFGIDPASLIHALQNHDEMTFELVHFWTLHKDDRFTLDGQEMSGSDLREKIRGELYAGLSGENAPYNLKFVTNGVACTTATIVAAALGIREIRSLTAEQIERIKQAHLLLVMVNAFQPGVFALSGWDLVGALTLPKEAVADLIADGDTRWINRGAYDLLGANPSADRSTGGLPVVQALYGSLPAQLADPASFARQLQHLLAVREQYQLYAARQIAIPDVAAPGLLIMVHELPEGRGIQVTALNFGADAVEESVTLPGATSGPVFDMIADREVGALTNGQLAVKLDGYAGKSYLVA